MALLFWDASALTKRYAPETGSNTVDAIFTEASAHTLRYARLTPGSPILLISADQRLLRAAQAEGVSTLDPESFPGVDLAPLLAAL